MKSNDVQQERAAWLMKGQSDREGGRISLTLKHHMSEGDGRLQSRV